MFIKSTKWKLKQLHVYILITDNYQLQFNVNIQRKLQQLLYTWYQSGKDTTLQDYNLYK